MNTLGPAEKTRRVDAELIIYFTLIIDRGRGVRVSSANKGIAVVFK